MTKSEVYLKDCMDLMAEYPDNYFDLAVVDPPYGISYDKMQNSMAGAKRKQNRGAWKEYHKTNWDKEKPSQEYFKELKRVSRNQIIWGANFYDAKPTKCWIIWDKIQRDNRADGELAWTSFNKPAKIFRYSRADAYINHCDQKIHPTQKPVALYDWIFKNYAEEGQEILDTHLGSGSSRISAFKNKLNFTGCEIDKDYFEASKKRFEDFTSQECIF